MGIDISGDKGRVGARSRVYRIPIINNFSLTLSCGSDQASSPSTARCQGQHGGAAGGDGGRAPLLPVDDGVCDRALC
jgi:hypothetical protein